MTDKIARVWNGTEWVVVSSPVGIPNSIAVFQSAPPSTPTDGQIWVDSDTTVALEWPTIGSGGGGGGSSVELSPIPPASPEIGDLWVDNSSVAILKVYDGSDWIVLASAPDDDQVILANRMFS